MSNRFGAHKLHTVLRLARLVAMRSLSVGVELVLILFVRRFQIRAYLRTNVPPRLHLGAGGRNFPGWCNVDLFQSPRAYLLDHPRILPVDLRRPLPIPTGSMEYLYSEHVHEHLTYAEGMRLTQECYRVLKPGGVVRISMPNIQTFINLVQNGVSTEDAKTFETACAVMGVYERHEPRTGLSLLNRIIGDKGHKYVYDFTTIADQLRQAGFREVVQVIPGASTHSVLHGLETSMYHRKDDQALLEFALWHTLSVEATK